jgi:hypothetical protein
MASTSILLVNFYLFQFDLFILTQVFTSCSVPEKLDVEIIAENFTKLVDQRTATQSLLISGLIQINKAQNSAI